MKTAKNIALTIAVIAGFTSISLITGCEQKPVAHCGSHCTTCASFCVEPSDKTHKALSGQEAIDARAAGMSPLYHHCAAGHTW